MMRGVLAVSMILSASQSQAALVYLCWVGNNGYTMTGTMEFPDALQDAPMVTEADVTRFKIAGYLDGNLLGTWDLADKTPTTTWYLRYIPSEMRFPTNGEVPGIIDQGWNADGTAEDCGNPGFGFNAGNYAQDFCVNGVWVEPSGMPPPTPFLAQNEAPYSTDCAGPKLMSRLELPWDDELG
ncbi:MAG: hypothetical protein NTX73_20260 [Rhodobacterales bacterium]|nr:hypothetical protein [Rhodobacterales bacterium]